MSKFTDDTTILIKGAKGKVNEEGQFSDDKTKDDFLKFIDAFKTLATNTISTYKIDQSTRSFSPIFPQKIIP
jgi:hypothetical protein